jgi:hypothetical protein
MIKELEGLDNGDRLFYADSGCEFDLNCENPKEEYDVLVKHLEKHKVIATLCNMDKHMTKMDLVMHLGMLNHPEYMTEQVQATTFLIEKCDETVALVQEWYETCCHYHLINDAPSVFPNRDDYDEHRHEQAVLSLLLKKRGFYSIPKEITLESVICMSRNRSGIHYPACRVTGSNFYCREFGDEFLDGYQVIHMSNLVRKHNPEYIMEIGFGSGRTAATVIQSCRKRPIKRFISCDKNYHLYAPYSVDYRDYFADMCPFFDWFEERTEVLLMGDFLRKELRVESLDWLTLDGSVRYEQVLMELLSVLCEMRLGGVIYVVGDMCNSKNVGLRCGVSRMMSIFVENLELNVESVMGKEIWYMRVKKALCPPPSPPPSPLDSSSSSSSSSTAASSSDTVPEPTETNN